jgi:hypothetical protein
MPAKKSRLIRSKKSGRGGAFARLKEYTRSLKYPRLTKRIGAAWLALAAIAVIAGATLVGGRQTSPPPVDIARADAPSSVPPLPGAKNPAAPEAPLARKVPAEPPAVVMTAANPSAESGARSRAPTLASVTITGCLERADETFRLKDTSGPDAPKSRSWKSGFLRKNSASVEVVDAASRLKLPDHVGQRVSVTGTLVDREMQIRSLQRVAASCAGSQKESN